jgi:carbon monoxide dehydrogenase subunit G
MIPKKTNVFAAVILISSNVSEHKYSISSDLGGIQSVYTPLVQQSVQSYLSPKNRKAANEFLDLKLKCFERPGNHLYIGVGQTQTIQAPLSKVKEVVDDVEHYVDLFPDYKKISVLTREGNSFVTDWEQIIPIPFVSNIRYQVNYVFEEIKPSTWAYRYQLKSSKDLIANDGVIFLEKITEGSTLFTEYDFWDAHWGLAKTFAPSKIWRDSVEGVAVSDLSIKLKSENPSWTYAQIQDQAKKMLSRENIEKCVENKKPFEGSF